MNGNETGPSAEKLCSIATSQGLLIQPKSIESVTYASHLGRTQLNYSDATNETFDLIFYNPETRLRGNMATQLGLDLTEVGDVKVFGLFHETSRRGVFASGDCASQVKMVAVAMGQGVSAGMGVNAQILEDDLMSRL